MKVAVLGSGDWGTALVTYLLNYTNNQVVWYVRESDLEHYKTTNRFKRFSEYTPSDIGDRLVMITNINDVIGDHIIVAIPTAFLEGELKKFERTERFRDLAYYSTWIIASKGMVGGKHISEFLIENNYSNIQNTVMISGPCHAEELVRGKNSYLDISPGPRTDAVIRDISSSVLTLHVLDKTTSIGNMEDASIFKNIIAIGAGIIDGFEMGDNFKAVYITSAIKSIQLRLDMYRDMYNLFSIGDILVTSYSKHSRNYRYGYNISTSNPTIEPLLYTPEGYNSLRQLYSSRKYSSILSDPWLLFVYRIVNEYTTMGSLKSDRVNMYIDDLKHHLFA